MDNDVRYLCNTLALTESIEPYHTMDGVAGTEAELEKAKNAMADQELKNAGGESVIQVDKTE